MLAIKTNVSYEGTGNKYTLRMISVVYIFFTCFPARTCLDISLKKIIRVAIFIRLGWNLRNKITCMEILS